MFIGHSLRIPSAHIGTVFNPTRLPGASATPILYVDCDTGVTLNGSNISALADQTGNGNNLAQATAVNQPPLVTGWRNGRNAMSAVISGADVRRLSRATFVGGILAQPYVQLIVGDWAAFGFFVAAAASTPATAPLFRNGANANCYAGTERVFAASSTWTALSFVAAVLVNGASTTIRARIQGLAAVNATVSGGTVGAQGYNGAIFGCNTGNAQQWGTNLAALGVYSGAMSTSDQDYLLQGLCRRYGILPL